MHGTIIPPTTHSTMVCICPCVWVINWYTLLARAAVVVEVIVTLKLDDPREDDLLRAVDASQQLGVVRVECRLHLGGEGVQVEVTVLRQLGIDAGVEAEVVLVGVGRLSRLQATLLALKCD